MAKRHGWRLLMLFVCIGLPLALFGELAEDVHASETFGFDQPILLAAHALASAGLDRLFIAVTDAGYLYGVVPFDIVLVLALLFARRRRETVFAIFAIVGSALLNLVAKHAFLRARPSLWQSIVHANGTSFPSGHAMGSATLALVLVLLAWPTRWRWPVAAVAVVFVLLVGFSRVYLGVHYPSDILGGWAAAAVWTFGVYGLVFNGSLRPWRRPDAPDDGT
ncbi:MAG: phosphatase PAP2 family protein [Rhodanobacteraceae bacterium]